MITLRGLYFYEDKIITGPKRRAPQSQINQRVHRAPDRSEATTSSQPT